MLADFPLFLAFLLPLKVAFPLILSVAVPLSLGLEDLLAFVAVLVASVCPEAAVTSSGAAVLTVTGLPLVLGWLGAVAATSAGNG